LSEVGGVLKGPDMAQEGRVCLLKSETGVAGAVVARA